jgi:4-amino-4-deoxy-L-arabinose transferase-like glycosyltransferase
LGNQIRNPLPLCGGGFFVSGHFQTDNKIKVQIPIFQGMRTRSIQVFSFAFALSLMYSIVVQLVNPEGHFLPDSWSYLNIGYNLFYEGSYSQLIDFPDVIDSARTPVYPGIIWFFHTIGLGAFPLIILNSAFFGGSAVLIFQILIRLLGSKELATLGSLVFAIDLPSLYMSSTVMTESCFVFLLLSGLRCFVDLKKGVWMGILAGILFGLAALTRPILFYFIPLLVFTPLLMRRIPWKTSILLVISFLALCSPWLIRNQKTFGIAGISTVGEVNLLLHTAANIRAESNGTSRAEEEANYRAQHFVADEWKQTTYPGKFSRTAKFEVLQAIQEEPLVFSKLWLKSCAFFFLKPMRAYFPVQFGLSEMNAWMPVEPNAGERPTDSLWVWLLVAYQLILLGLLYRGLLPLLRRSEMRGIVLLLFIALLYFAAVSALTEADARLRVSAIPLILMLSGMGWKKVLSP